MMADLKLKNETLEIELDKDYYVFNFKGLDHHKITSRRFPQLLGENEFSSVGYTILEMFRMLESEGFDNWYTLRGAVGEHFVNEYIKTVYFKDQVCETKQFAPQQFKFYDQFNTLNDTYGGVIDIALLKPFRSIFECKAKSINNLQYIERLRPTEEVSQGELLASLSRVSIYYMAYAFFTQEQEDKMKRMAEKIQASGLKIGDVVYKELPNILKSLGFKLDDIVIRIYEYKIDESKTNERMRKALQVVKNAQETNRIHKSLFTQSEQNYLNQFVKTVEVLDDAEVFKRYLEMGKK